jgi:hypothetical protein
MPSECFLLLDITLGEVVLDNEFYFLNSSGLPFHQNHFAENLNTVV